MVLAGLLLPFISSAQRKPDVQAHLIRGPYLQVASSTQYCYSLAYRCVTKKRGEL